MKWHPWNSVLNNQAGASTNISSWHPWNNLYNFFCAKDTTCSYSLFCSVLYTSNVVIKKEATSVFGRYYVHMYVLKELQYCKVYFRIERVEDAMYIFIISASLGYFCYTFNFCKLWSYFYIKLWLFPQLLNISNSLLSCLYFCSFYWYFTR